ncbi:hypothetical protein GCM10027299_55900 [Larkinella ripae]
MASYRQSDYEGLRRRCVELSHGGHVSNIGGLEGRIYTEMIPFFNTYLTIESKER